MSAPESFSFDDRRIESTEAPEKRELALFQWLSSLEKDLGKTSKDALKPHQAALEKLLLKYLASPFVKPSRPIRELIARCLVMMYHKGDQRSLFDSLAAAQTMLANKKLDDPAVKIAIIHCIGVLTESHGAKVMSLFAETANLLIKALRSARDTDVALKYETFKALSRVLAGAGKGASDATVKDLMRFAKAGISDKLPIVRRVSAELLSALYQHTSQTPPTTLKDFESLFDSFTKSLEGSNYAVRRAFANLIAGLLTIAQTPGNLAKFSPKRSTKTDPAVSAAAAAEMTILTETEIFTLISNQFIKAASRESRTGIMEALATFLRRSGVKFVETHYPLILKSMVDLASNPKAAAIRTEAPFVNECCAFVMREVVGKMLTETGQANSVREIVSNYLARWPAVLATDIPPTDQALAFVLGELAALFSDLGPAANECQEGVIQALFGILPHPSPTVRNALAWTFRAFCLALPEHLTGSLGKLVGVLQKDMGLLTVDRPEVADRVIGYANVLAAVISVLPLHPLYAVYEDAATVFGFSTQLLKSMTGIRDARISACQTQIAWTLIGALMCLGPNFVKVHLSQLLLIWKNVFPKSQPKDINANRNELDWTFQLVSRESALAALYSFLTYNSKELATNDVAKRIVVCLNNTLHFLSTIPSTYGAPIDQTQASPSQIRLFERECQLRRRLFLCYKAVTPTSTYDTAYAQLVKATLDAFALDPDRPDRFPYMMPGTQPKDGVLVIESVMPTSLVFGHTVSVAADSEAEDRGIARVLVRETDVQGLEDLIERRIFGSCDNDPHAMYLASSLVKLSERDAAHGLADRVVARPAPPPANIAVVDAAVELFSMLFPLQTAQAQETFAEHIFKTATFQGGKLTPVRKAAAQINSLVAVIGLLKYVMVKRGQIASGKVSVTIREMVDPFLKSPDAATRTICSEILGRLARVVGTATFVNPMIQSLVDQVVNNREPEARAGSALALGCINSFVGGMAASSHLNTIVGILHSLASDAHPLVHTWALHALWLTIESSGLMYGPYVNATLTLVVRLLMSDSHEPGSPSANIPTGDSNADVCPAFGRILHALVGVIGPELQMSTSLRDICFSLYEQLKNDRDPFVVVEAIRCIQNFILFARKFVDIETLIPFLQLQLSGDSRTQVYMIRKASVTCLYQLTQHDPETVLSATIGNQLEEQLFALMDIEMDKMIRSEIKDILVALLRHVAPRNPSRWLDLCKSILSKSTIAEGGAGAAGAPGASAAAPGTGAAAAGAAGGDGSVAGGVGATGTGRDDDDDDMEGGLQSNVASVGAAAAAGAAAGKDTKPGVPGVASGGAREIVVVLLPRWRTQVFALSCLRVLMSVVLETNQPEHLDMAAARTKRAALAAQGKPSDFLVFRLVDLIKMAFTSSTANVNDLRLGGLYLLRDLVEKYATVPDPDFDGHPLLEQYQAQIIAALAPAFNKESSPEIISTACGVCSFFIGISEDVPAMGRPLKLLGNLLEQFADDRFLHSLPSPNAFVMLKLATLKAWAELHSFIPRMPDMQSVISPHMDLLVRLWLSVLQDYAKLTIDADASGVSGAMDTSPGINLYMSATRQVTLPFYQSSWILILRSVASLIEQKAPAIMKLLVQPDDDADGGSNSSMGQRAKTFFMLFGLCIETVSASSSAVNAMSFSGQAGNVVAAAERAKTQASETERIVICLESIRKMLGEHVLGPGFLPTSVFLELLSVLDRLVEMPNHTVQMLVVSTIELILSQYGSTYFARSGYYGSASDSSHPLAVPASGSIEYLAGGDGGDHSVSDKVFRVSRVLFSLVASYVPGLAQFKTPPVTLSKPLTPETARLLVKAFETLAIFARCTSLAPPDRVTVTAQFFATLVALLNAPKFATDVLPTALVLIKPVLETAAPGDDRDREALGLCLCATVATLLDAAADQIDDTPGPDGTSKNQVAEMAALKNAFLGIMLIMTMQPALSHHPANQERIVELVRAMMESPNSELAVLATQYARTLILLSCRAEEVDAQIGASHLRLLLPVVARVVMQTGLSVAAGTADASRVPVLEESLKTLALLAASTSGERQRLAALAVLVPLFLSAMTDMPDAGSAVQFNSVAAKGMHLFATQALLQFASQQQQQFKVVLQTLSDDQKSKLERAFKSLVIAQSGQASSTRVAAGGANLSSPTVNAAGRASTGGPKIELKNFANFE
ncbi:hypothetical protein HK105_203722 [Polyrhizophydium stewartii]|uniref:LAA1-like C-terminal TPR repeats domain-containing protein n=1 Tax=Polyrhizophydium stewartii TaxID=2732419 RepID=A0ABR4NAQ9_9FUNG